MSAEASELDLEEVRQVAAFRLALRRFHAVSDRITRRNGLTPRQYLLLLALEASGGRHGHMNIGQIVAALALAQGTVTELVARCEHAGLVRRSSSPSDRRVAVVRATAEGRRRFASAYRALAREREALRSAAEELARRADRAG